MSFENSWKPKINEIELGDDIYFYPENPMIISNEDKYWKVTDVDEKSDRIYVRHPYNESKILSIHITEIYHLKKRGF